MHFLIKIDHLAATTHILFNVGRTLSSTLCMMSAKVQLQQVALPLLANHTCSVTAVKADRSFSISFACKQVCPEDRRSTTLPLEKLFLFIMARTRPSGYQATIISLTNSSQQSYGDPARCRVVRSAAAKIALSLMAERTNRQCAHTRHERGFTSCLRHDGLLRGSGAQRSATVVA